MIEYKYPYLQMELEVGAHPELKKLAHDFADWSETNGVKAPIITCVFRPASDPLEVGKFGWHQVHCAADFRCHHYSDDEAQRVKDWLQHRCIPVAQWELITKPHGTAPHYHVAFRDMQWKGGHHE